MVKMKRVTIIRVIGEEQKCRELLYEPFKAFIPRECSRYNYTGGQLNLPLTSDSTELFVALEIAQKNNIDYTLFSEVRYTSKEVESCEYYLMRILSPLESEGTNAADYGTQYRGKCVSCGVGGEVDGPVLIDRKLLNKRNWDIGNLRPHIYVTEKLRKIFVQNDFSGISFDHEVLDYRGREMKKNYVLSIHNILPKMDETTWLFPNGIPCKECGYQSFYLRSDIQYHKNKLQNAKDFNLTLELVDAFRQPEIVVSARVRRICKENKIYAGFTPITIVNGESAR